MQTYSGPSVARCRFTHTASQRKMPIVLIKLVELHSGIDNVIICEFYALILDCLIQ